MSGYDHWKTTDRQREEQEEPADERCPVCDRPFDQASEPSDAEPCECCGKPGLRR